MSEYYVSVDHHVTSNLSNRPATCVPIANGARPAHLYDLAWVSVTDFSLAMQCT